MKEMNSPEMKEKWTKGPVGFMTILPSGPPAMGKNLVLWFLYSVLIGVFVAYVGSLAMGASEDYMRVFRVKDNIR